MLEDENNQDDDDKNGGVKIRVRSWVSGFANEMRKKSHVTVQKWVDSISVADEKLNCDSNELNINEPSTSAAAGGTSVKGKFTEICNKLNVNEKIKNKKIEFKNLISKTTHKIKKENSKDLPIESSKNMDEQQQKEEESNETVENENENETELKNEDDQKEIKDESNTLTVQRCHISVLGRSCSENPKSRSRRRLTDIGRSFSVAQDDELLPSDSTDNLIYDADEDVSITNASFNTTSPSILSNKTNSSNQLDKSALTMRSSLSHMRPLREHTVSEGHYSPQVLPKNPLLRDSSFQSDSSHCSSVESLLEARKPDAEAILVNLGFGPVHGSDDILTKIPKRFLKPSQVKGVDTDTFLKNQQLSMNIHENSVLGYRGLLGNPHTPPSDIVRAIMNRFSQNEMQRMASMENISTQRSFKGVANTILLAHRQFTK